MIDFQQRAILLIQLIYQLFYKMKQDQDIIAVPGKRNTNNVLPKYWSFAIRCTFIEQVENVLLMQRFTQGCDIKPHFHFSWHLLLHKWNASAVESRNIFEDLKKLQVCVILTSVLEVLSRYGYKMTFPRSHLSTTLSHLKGSPMMLGTKLH